MAVGRTVRPEPACPATPLLPPTPALEPPNPPATGLGAGAVERPPLGQSRGGLDAPGPHLRWAAAPRLPSAPGDSPRILDGPSPPACPALGSCPRCSDGPSPPTMPALGSCPRGSDELSPPETPAPGACPRSPGGLDPLAGSMPGPCPRGPDGPRPPAPPAPLGARPREAAPPPMAWAQLPRPPAPAARREGNEPLVGQPLVGHRPHACARPARAAGWCAIRGGASATWQPWPAARPRRAGSYRRAGRRVGGVAAAQPPPRPAPVLGAV
mmetsp:Transcript_42182/g.123470  ORF Transcript_42182/g.123470 Transcript_42182/m.123470 type:complete len:269 (+) Transcript_42182:415-1221(+)